jgi:Domain of unknown function (DUF4333)
MSVGAGLAVTALLAGCGGGGSTASGRPRYLDTARVARAIAQSIATDRHLRARVVCPSGIVQRKNYQFACLAVYDGGQATFTVIQHDDRGHVTYAGH